MNDASNLTTPLSMLDIGVCMVDDGSVVRIFSMGSILLSASHLTLKLRDAFV